MSIIGAVANYLEENWYPTPAAVAAPDETGRRRRPRRNLFQLVCFGLGPLLVAYGAVVVAYVISTPVPAGTIFWMIFRFQGLFIGAPTPAVPPGATATPRPANEQFLDLPGGSRMPMSGLGMCCRPSAYEDESVRRSVLWYLLQGGRLIDTADLYLNHKAVGLGIKDAIARGIPRSEIFVATKIWSSHYGEKFAPTRLKVMLKDLDLDYVDLVMMHVPRRNFGLWPGLLPNFDKVFEWDDEHQGYAYMPGSFWPGHEDKDFKSYGCETVTQCRQQTWKALSDARDQGLVKEIGVSNFRIYQMRELMRMKVAPIAVNQIAFHPWAPESQRQIVEFCQKNNIAVTAYTSLGGAQEKAKAISAPAIQEIAAAHKRSPALVLQRWAIQKNISVIPGSGNPTHMKENLEVFGFQLSAEDMTRLDALSQYPILTSIPDFLNQ